MGSKVADVFEAGFEAMGASAAAQGITGAGVVAYLEDAENVEWELRVRIFGNRIEIPAQGEDRGWNLIGMACSKIAESILTKVQSGSSPRPLEHGEEDQGSMGADIKACGKGYVAAGFGGGASEQDLVASRAAIEAMIAKLA